MPTIREVHDAFERMISEQKKAVKSLQGEREATRTLRRDAETHLGGLSGVAPIVPDLSEETLTLLTKAMSKIWTGVKTPVEQARDATQKDSEITEKLAQHLADWGPLAELESQKSTLAVALSDVEAEQLAHQTQREILSRRLSGVTGFNGVGCTLPLIRENQAHYETFNLWSYLSDHQYRQGHSILKKYSRAGYNVFDDQDAHKVAEQAIKTATEQKADLSGRFHIVMGRVDDIVGLQAAYGGPEAILQTLRNDVKKLLIANEHFANDLAPHLPSHYARPIVMTALKIRNYAKIEDGLDKTLKQVLSTICSLEEPMSKLAKGKRYKPSKSINVDLKKIEESVKAQRAISGYHSISASRARGAVQDYNPSKTDTANNDMMNMQNLLLLYIILSSDTDPAYLNQTFGLSEDVAASANIDLGNLTPDIAGAIGGDLGAIGDSIGQIDLGTIDVGSIDIGSIDIGSIDVGNNDNWGGGGGSDFSSGPSGD